MSLVWHPDRCSNNGAGCAAACASEVLWSLLKFKQTVVWQRGIASKCPSASKWTTVTRNQGLGTNGVAGVIVMVIVRHPKFVVAQIQANRCNSEALWVNCSSATVYYGPNASKWATLNVTRNQGTNGVVTVIVIQPKKLESKQTGAAATRRPSRRHTRSAGISSGTSVQKWTRPVNSLPYLTLPYQSSYQSGFRQFVWSISASVTPHTHTPWHAGVPISPAICSVAGFA